MKELKKNFYCGDEVDYDDKCLEQCENCNDATGVDYGYLPEEAAEIRYGSDQFLWAKQRDGFIEGAKWQQERSYSEEEVHEMFDTLKRNSIDNVATISNIDLFISSWKKQFKNK